MLNRRSHKDRNRHKLARAFMTQNMSSKSMMQQQEDFNLGLKVESGTLETVSDVMRAMDILGVLEREGRITSEHAIEIKMDLAQKMSGFKIVPK